MSFCAYAPVPMRVIANLLGQNPDINSSVMQNVRDCALLQTSNVKIDGEPMEVVSLHRTTWQLLRDKLLITVTEDHGMWNINEFINKIMMFFATYKLLLQHKNLTEQLPVLLSQLRMMYPGSSRRLLKCLLLNILIFSGVWLLVMSSITRPCTHTWNLLQ